MKLTPSALWASGHLSVAPVASPPPPIGALSHVSGSAPPQAVNSMSRVTSDVKPLDLVKVRQTAEKDGVLHVKRYKVTKTCAVKRLGDMILKLGADNRDVASLQAGNSIRVYETEYAKLLTISKGIKDWSMTDVVNKRKEYMECINALAKAVEMVEEIVVSLLDTNIKVRIAKAVAKRMSNTEQLKVTKPWAANGVCAGHCEWLCSVLLYCCTWKQKFHMGYQTTSLQI